MAVSPTLRPKTLMMVQRLAEPEAGVFRIEGVVSVSDTELEHTPQTAMRTTQATDTRIGDDDSQL